MTDIMLDYDAGREAGKKALEILINSGAENPKVPGNVDELEWIHGYFDYIERYFQYDWFICRKLLIRKHGS